MIVYKVDRLTRALADFARIVAIFDAAGVSFVAVTQAFNTTSSMGRLTLNVLLSFAQFEREVTAERVRDKIAASKAKGIWMGGPVPIGYRTAARSLQPAPEEAALVRRIFARYLALGSVSKLKAELDAAGLRTPERLHRSGSRGGGAAFSRGRLYALLANPLCIGRIRHRDQVHPGQHPPIVEAALWQAVQEQLAANRRSRSLPRTARAPSPLAGRLFDPEGRKMRPSHASRKGRRYRYYVSAGLVEAGGAAGAAGWRIPAREIEAAVGRAVAARLRDPELQSAVLRGSPSASEASARLIARMAQLADRLEAPASAAGREALRLLIARVELSRSELRATASFQRLKETRDAASIDPVLSAVPPFLVVAPLRLRRRGPELRLVLQGAAAPPPKPDPLLVRQADRGAHACCRLPRPRPGSEPQHHRPSCGRACRRRLAVAAARLPGSGPGRGDPRRHPAGRPHPRATEAGPRAAAALGRAAGDARRRRAPRRRSLPANGSRSRRQTRRAGLAADRQTPNQRSERSAALILDGGSPPAIESR